MSPCGHDEGKGIEDKVGWNIWRHKILVIGTLLVDDFETICCINVAIHTNRIYQK